MTRTIVTVIIFYIVIYTLLLLYQLGIGNPFQEDVSPVLILFVFWLIGILALVAVFMEKKHSA